MVNNKNLLLLAISETSCLFKICNFNRNICTLNLFELTLKMNGFPISEAKAQLQKIQSIPERDYKDYVLKKRQEIFDFHISENPFYQKFVGSNKIASWEEVPVMQKADLQTIN